MIKEGIKIDSKHIVLVTKRTLFLCFTLVVKYLLYMLEKIDYRHRQLLIQI